MINRNPKRRSEFNIQRGTPKDNSLSSEYSSRAFEGDDAIDPTSLYVDKDVTFLLSEDIDKANDPKGRSARQTHKPRQNPNRSSNRPYVMHQATYVDEGKLGDSNSDIDRIDADTGSGSPKANPGQLDTSPDKAASPHRRPVVEDDLGEKKGGSAHTPSEPPAAREAGSTASSDEAEHKGHIQTSQDEAEEVNGDIRDVRHIQASNVRSIQAEAVSIQPRKRYSSTTANDNPNIYYMDGNSLTRPLSIPKKSYKVIALLVALAAVIGCAFLYQYFDNTVNAPQREQELIEKNLSQDIAFNIPNLASLVPLDDAGIISTLSQNGDTIFNLSEIKGSSNLEIVRFPEGVSTTDAAAMYMKGIDKLSGSEASRLLNGSWDLRVDRSKGTNIGIHFADFKSGSIDAAIQAAIASQGFDSQAITKSGTDDSGNTYSIGDVTIDGALYSWKISAIPLSEIYSINGLPEDAVYLGIRITD